MNSKGRPFLQDKCSVYPLIGIWKRMRGSNEIYDKAIKSTFENIMQNCNYASDHKKIILFHVIN